MEFRGTYTAIVTPFLANEEIDWTAFDALIEGQIEGGVAGIVPCGTTGESPTLSHAEKEAVIARTVEKVRGRAQVIAGTGTNSTKGTIDASVHAERAGVDAVMVVCPYYNKPTQEGLYQHYARVAGSVKCPIMIYNIPGRTGIDLLPDAMDRLLDKCANIVAVKEATGNVVRAQELVRRFGHRLTVLCGDDALTLAMVAVGARGVVSVASNLYPKEVSSATRLALAADPNALAAHQALLPVYEAMFLESNPAPVKAAMAHKGRLANVVRGPLTVVSKGTEEKIVGVLQAHERGR